MKEFFYFFIFFLFYYGVKFASGFGFLYLLYAIPFLVGSIQITVGKLMLGIRFIFLFLFLMCSLILTMLLNGFYEPVSLLIMFKIIFNISSCLGFYVLAFSRYSVSEGFYRLLLWLAAAAIIQSLFVFLSLYCHWYNSNIWIVIKHLGNIRIDNGVRAFGFSNAGGDGLSYKMLIGFLSLLYIGWISRITFINILFFIISFSLVFFSFFFVARTGLVISVFISGVYFTLSLIYMPKKTFLYISFLCLIGVYLYCCGSDYISSQTYKWSMEFFFKGTGTSSIETLESMMILPTKISTYIYGDGHLSNGVSNYMSIDIGYLRLIYFSGVVPVLMVLLYIFDLYRRLCYRLDDRSQSVLLLAIFSLVIIFNLKTLFFDGGLIVKILTLLYCIIISPYNSTLLKVNKENV
ncbi:MAG: hypothetical protein CL816_01780 [Coxiellaceae bacterium]|nr:hypothetical protein [Coxiellaceae bacterium]|tara:strand:+ start:6655 stop:7872 length:1218 start_codon:yes stop_codon:yes gene_type:complete